MKEKSSVKAKSEHYLNGAQGVEVPVYLDSITMTYE